MADNVTIPATGTGTATPVVATDDVGGAHYQRVKLDLGADGASAPVTGTVPVSGSVTVGAALPAGTNNIGDVDILSIAAGDNNIGNVDIVTLPSLPAGINNIGDVDVLTLPATPAGTNLIGSVNAQLDASTMRDGAGMALTPKFAIIDAATSGDNTLVAAVASKKVRVLALFLVAAGTVNARLESGAGGTALTGQMNLVANTGFVLPFNPVGWFETAVNTLLNLELSAAISADGSLVYVEV